MPRPQIKTSAKKRKLLSLIKKKESYENAAEKNISSVKGSNITQNRRYVALTVTVALIVTSTFTKFTHHHNPNSL